MPNDQSPPVPRPPKTGLRRVGRNGYPPDTQNARRLIDLLHTNAGYRMKVLDSWSVDIPSLPTAAAATDTVISRALVHTSPNCSDVAISLALAPTSSADTSGINPTVYLVSKAANTGTQPATLSSVTTKATFTVTNPSTSAVTPDDLTYVDGVFGLSSDTTYALELHTSDRARVLACSIYELPRTYLATASDVAVDASAVLPGGPVYGSTLADIGDSGNTLRKRGGRRVFGWSETNGGNVHSSGSGYVNIFDPSVNGWNAGYPGFWAFTQDCGTLTQGSDSVMCWAYAEVLSGTGEAKFYRSGATIASVTLSGSDAGYFTTAGWLVTSEASSYIVADIKGDGDKGIALYSAGIYEYEA